MNDQYEDAYDRRPEGPPEPPPVTVDDILAAARKAHAATNAPVWDDSEMDFRALAKAGLIVDLAERYKQAVAAAKAALDFGALPASSTAREWCRLAVLRSSEPLVCEPPPAAATFITPRQKPGPKVPAVPPAKPDLFSQVEETP